MPPHDYDHEAIEARWRAFWDSEGIFARRPEPENKFYCLMMYPYPSGALHMGHVINYAIGDAVTRYLRRKGRNVLSPMGWDSFGLPAENAAIRTGIHPARFTYDNIDRMRNQMVRAGWAYDWTTELATSHPGYFKWTQWLFLQFFKHDLAVKKEAPVNWCPSCKTVLANEQAHQGKCERCGTEVEARRLSQWFLPMSSYAQRLLDGHAELEGNWPDRVLKMQKEWIGRSEGVEVVFTIRETGHDVPIYTTRPDTIYGVTFLVLAPEHPLLPELMRGRPNERQVLDAARRMSRQSREARTGADTEKEGVPTGLHVVNPYDGAASPLWIANYALMEYGTGAVMAVPAHDQRDFEFARKYKLDIKVVIRPEDTPLSAADMARAYESDGIQVDSGPFDGLPNKEAWGKIAAMAEQKGFGKRTVNYRLKDWLISRQRYWGAPIPIIYCDKCGMVPVPDDQLPVLLPEDVQFKPTGDSPLASHKEFLHADCPRCGAPAKRETDTMDTFVDSSWYFLRYLSPRNTAAAFDDAQVSAWMPVDLYVGGIEHATMHLIYARFFTMALKDMGLVPFSEPFRRLFCQGMVQKVAYRCPQHLWLSEQEVDLNTLTCRQCGSAVEAEMAKMSKTKLNVVSPDDVIERFGADTMHTYILFMGPPDQDMVYSEQGLIGVYRFMKRLFQDVSAAAAGLKDVPPYAGPGSDLNETEKQLRLLLHTNLRRAGEAFEKTMHFNTVIAGDMEIMNALRDARDAVRPEVHREILGGVIDTLSPFAPHVSEELFHLLGGTGSLFTAPWPQADESALRLDEIEYPVQVNGKLRARITVASGAAEDDIRSAAMAAASDKLQGLDVKKVIVIRDRLVNIVAR
ncbi:MAG: leucine--tRNA ligase [Planctomycetes bacterium]|nr:leucine--tRNA ligase [Planctomycetota bacterium]